MSHHITSETPIPLSEVEKILKERETTAPLNYIQRVTLDHAHRFSDSRADNQLVDKIVETFGLERLTAIQIVNVCPKSLIDVTAVLGESADESLRKKILQFYNEHISSQPEEITQDLEPEQHEKIDVDEIMELDEMELDEELEEYPEDEDLW